MKKINNSEKDLNLSTLKKYEKLLTDELEIKLLLYSAIIKLPGWFSNGDDVLIEKCPNGNIECI